MTKDPVVETYRGARIRFSDEDGFHSSPWGENFGYADNVEAIRSEIDDYLAGPDDDRARQAIGWPNASEAP